MTYGGFILYEAPITCIVDLGTTLIMIPEPGFSKLVKMTNSEVDAASGMLKMPIGDAGFLETFTIDFPTEVRTRLSVSFTAASEVSYLN